MKKIIYVLLSIALISIISITLLTLNNDTSTSYSANVEKQQTSPTVDTLTDGVTTWGDAFPDEGFRNAISMKIIESTVVKDKELTQSEIDKIHNSKELYLGPVGINSFEGLIHFENLIKFTSSDNPAATVEIPLMQKLEYVSIWSPDLNTLIIQNLPNLTTIDVVGNEIATIVLENLPTIKELSLYGYGLTSIDLSSLTSLQVFDAEYNKLTSVTLPDGLKYLNLGGNQLESLDISNCDNLESAYLNNNKINSIALPDSIKHLDLNNNLLTSIDLSGLDELESISISNNQLTSLIIESLKLESLNASSNKINELRIDSENMYLISVDANNLTTLNFSNQSSLWALNVSFNFDLHTLSLPNNFYTQALVFNYDLTKVNFDTTQFTGIEEIGLGKSSGLSRQIEWAFEISGSKNKENPRWITFLLAGINRIESSSAGPYYIYTRGETGDPKVPNPGRTGFSKVYQNEHGVYVEVNTHFFDEDKGGLIDFEGNFYVGATESDIRSDGALVINRQVKIITANGIINAFDGVVAKDGVIKTNGSIEYQVNGFDEENFEIIPNFTTIKATGDISIYTVTNEVVINSKGFFDLEDGSRNICGHNGVKFNTNGLISDDATYVKVNSSEVPSLNLNDLSNVIIPINSIIIEKNQEVAQFIQDTTINFDTFELASVVINDVPGATINLETLGITTGIRYIVDLEEITVKANVSPHYNFIGWNDGTLIINSNEEYSFMVTNDITLTPILEAIKFTITFDTNQGSLIDSVQVASGTKISKPTNPTRDGFTFEGWYTDSSLLSDWDFNSYVTSNLTLHAKWIINTFIVEFQTNGGTSISSETVNYGTVVTRPTNPTKTGSVFDGWYIDAAFTLIWDFDTKLITQDSTIYAKWVINTHVVSFDTDGGTFVNSQLLSYGSLALTPVSPTKDGSTFDGWYKDAACTVEWNFATDSIVADTTIYAKWQTLEVPVESAENNWFFNIGIPAGIILGVTIVITCVLTSKRIKENESI